MEGGWERDVVGRLQRGPGQVAMEGEDQNQQL